MSVMIRRTHCFLSLLFQDLVWQVQNNPPVNTWQESEKCELSFSLQLCWFFTLKYLNTSHWFESVHSEHFGRNLCVKMLCGESPSCMQTELNDYQQCGVWFIMFWRSLPWTDQLHDISACSENVKANNWEEKKNYDEGWHSI